MTKRMETNVASIEKWVFYFLCGFALFSSTSIAMGNAIAMEDTNGNRKLLKKRYEAKIDPVASMMDAFIAYKLNKEAFE